jgi:hypothetical protein
MLSGNYLSAQIDHDNALKSHYKVSIFYLREVVNISTIAFEKDISSNTSIDISANVIWLHGEYHHTLSELIYATYKYYIPTEKKFLKDIWFGPYLDYFHTNQFYYTGYYCNRKYNNGIGTGIAFGRKNFIGKKRTIFIDTGFGLSINAMVETDKVNCTISTEFPFFIPRIIFLFGISN